VVGLLVSLERGVFLVSKSRRYFRSRELESHLGSLIVATLSRTKRKKVSDSSCSNGNCQAKENPAN
jgi:hypothetical protein